MDLSDHPWELLGTEAGGVTAPESLAATGWRPAVVPGTVAQALALPLDGAGADIDGLDWWYRCRFPGPNPAEPAPRSESRRRLHFDGLATLAQVWLNGALVLESKNMFRPFTVHVELQAENELILCFRSVKAALGTRRPRPRWKTGLVDQQNLRWIRTSLLGRIPGWTPPLPAIGPWRGVRVEAEDGADRNDEVRTVDVVVPDPARPAFVLNGRPLFSRGACWTVDDVRAIDGAPAVTRETLRLCAAAGMNMIRVGGTMAYASETLLDLCDELGIFVWQDLMFANMDYPLEDDGFRAEVEGEIEAQLRRLRRHPCVVAVCGGSEVEQQAAMMGLPRSDWSNPLFEELVQKQLAAVGLSLPYFPSTPTGGALPFHTAVGLTHYYGVGAYKRPLADVRAAHVAFTPECLGFSNIPEPDHLERHFGTAKPAPHLPAWKAGVPRDNGAGWDFEDVRDHYLQQLFGVDPVALRYADLERYYALSRVVTGELMLRTFAEWRRPGSGCNGGLVWFLKDLRPGAGWGILDSENRPKACYWYLKRAWASRAVLLTDEGLNGIDLHVLNEEPTELVGVVELELVRSHAAPDAAHARPRNPVAVHASVYRTPVRVAAFGSQTFSGEALVGSFSDLSNAYRFGPPRHDVVVARLIVDEQTIHEDVFFPISHAVTQVGFCLTAAITSTDGDQVTLTLNSSSFLQAVSLGCPGFEPDDDYFHLPAGRPKCVRLRCTSGKPLRAWITALNMEGGVAVRG